MTKLCRAPGCMDRAHGRWSVHCNAHEKAYRRHGAVDQRGVTKARLKPYTKLVEARIRRNRDRVNWAAVDERWLAVVGVAKGILQDHEAGKAMEGWMKDAAQAAVRLSLEVEPREVTRTVVALYLMLRGDPRWFANDRGFRFQLVRCVRRLSEVNAGSFFNANTGRVHRVYRDLHPKATEHLAQWLITALGPVGVHFQRLEEQEARQHQEARTAFLDTLDNIK